MRKNNIVVLIISFIISIPVFCQESDRVQIPNMSDWKPYVKEETKITNDDAWHLKEAQSVGNLKPTRFLSRDGLADKFPGWSPYHYSGNNPIAYIDPTGTEWYYYQAEGQKEAQWNYQKDTKEMSVWNGQYDKDNNKVMETRQGIVQLLTFDGSQLNWLRTDGGTQSWAAVSGVLDENGKTQPGLQGVANTGPLPEGWYSVDPNTSKSINNATNIIDFMDWLVKFPAWGEAYTPIFTQEGSSYYPGGRHSAFIHGGFSPGSAGCIDLTNNNSYFHTVFTRNGQKMPLNVKYPGF